MNSITLLSYAKINVGLKVVGRRPDGYHSIRSLFQEVDLADTLTFDRLLRNTVEVECDAPGVPSDSRNLAARAAHLLKDEMGFKGGVRITLQKEIPVGAGMGGGSSNAAATLNALNRLWNLGLSDGRFHALAQQLGSDVPFFLSGGSALVSGRGEHIDPLRGIQNVCFVAVDPGYRVDTTWAYAKLEFALTEHTRYISFLNSVKASGCVNLKRLFDSIENDFLPVVSANYPAVSKVLARLESAGSLCSSMTGSGSVLFGCFHDRIAAEHAADQLKSAGYRAWPCQPRTI
jgi:4-diphosphocytidyl-2-C-methyl-D-erythritol kinase